MPAPARTTAHGWSRVSAQSQCSCAGRARGREPRVHRLRRSRAGQRRLLVRLRRSQGWERRRCHRWDQDLGRAHPIGRAASPRRPGRRRGSSVMRTARRTARSRAAPRDRGSQNLVSQVVTGVCVKPPGWSRCFGFACRRFAAVLAIGGLGLGRSASCLVACRTGLPHLTRQRGPTATRPSAASCRPSIRRRSLSIPSKNAPTMHAPNPAASAAR